MISIDAWASIDIIVNTKNKKTLNDVSLSVFFIFFSRSALKKLFFFTSSRWKNNFAKQNYFFNVMKWKKKFLTRVSKKKKVITMFYNKHACLIHSYNFFFVKSACDDEKKRWHFKKACFFENVIFFQEGVYAINKKNNALLFFFLFFLGGVHPPKRKKKNSWNFIFAAGILKRKKWIMTVIFWSKLGCLDPPKITVE
jgi:hypothetical protein